MKRTATIAMIAAVAALSAAAGIVWWVVVRPARVSPGPAAVRPLPAPMDACWPIHRGDSALTGRAEGKLGDRLRLYWRFQTGDQVQASPVVAGGLVYFGSWDCNVYAVTLDRGRLKWSVPTGGMIAGSCRLDRGRLYVGNRYGRLYCLDPNTGRPIWRRDLNGEINGAVNAFDTPQGRRAIVVGTYDQKLRALRADDGNDLWEYSAKQWFHFTPAVWEGLAACGTCDGNVHVVRLSDGTGQAQYSMEAQVSSTVAVRDGRAYVGSYAGELVCFDIRTGGFLWWYDTSSKPVLGSPAVAEGRVVFGSDDHQVHCCDLEGKGQWTFRARAEVQGSPVICDGRVIVGAGDGRLYLLRLSDGRKLWEYDLGQPVSGSPAVFNGCVIVGCDDGAVYAFGPP